MGLPLLIDLFQEPTTGFALCPNSCSLVKASTWSKGSDAGRRRIVGHENDATSCILSTPDSGNVTFRLFCRSVEHLAVLFQ